MKLTEYLDGLEQREAKLRVIIDTHQNSLAKFPLEEQHIIGEKEGCGECEATKKAFQEILDFEKEVLGFSRMQANMTNMTKLIIKIIEMKDEEK